MDDYLLDTIITREMIEQGYKQGIVQLVDDDWCFGKETDDEDEICDIMCRIGEFTFFFDEDNANDTTIKDYLKNVSYDDIINNICETLSDMQEHFEDEYLYYYWYLKENLKSEQIGA